MSAGCQTQWDLGTLGGCHGQQEEFSVGFCHHSPLGNNHSPHSTFSHDRALLERKEPFYQRTIYPFSSSTQLPLSDHNKSYLCSQLIRLITRQVTEQTWEKAKQVKRCFNENMIRKPLLEHFRPLLVMIPDHFWCFFFCNGLSSANWLLGLHTEMGWRWRRCVWVFLKSWHPSHVVQSHYRHYKHKMSLMYVLWNEEENRKSGKTDFNVVQNYSKKFPLIFVTGGAFSMKFRNVMYCFHLLQINILLFLPFSISSKFSLQYSTKRQRKMDSALSMWA